MKNRRINIKIILFVILVVILLKNIKINERININDKLLKFFFNTSNDVIVKKKNVDKNNILSILDTINLNYENVFGLSIDDYDNTNNADVSKFDKRVPTVYIYNTHQTEKYALSNNDVYNIVPTVMTTSYILQEQLSIYNINSFVEEKKVNDVLKKNNWNYAYSYMASRKFMEDAKNENDSLNFFIDVHRDSVSKNISTTEINGKKYAKILFIVGLENDNYKDNLELTEKINNDIKNEYPSLTRGIYKKKGKGVNGVYNQDFSPNCILIEFGGEENTIDEVYNTVVVVSKFLSKYIGEINEE